MYSAVAHKYCTITRKVNVMFILKTQYGQFVIPSVRPKRDVSKFLRKMTHKLPDSCNLQKTTLFYHFIKNYFALGKEVSHAHFL